MSDEPAPPMPYDVARHGCLAVILAMVLLNQVLIVAELGVDVPTGYSDMMMIAVVFVVAFGMLPHINYAAEVIIRNAYRRFAGGETA